MASKDKPQKLNVYSQNLSGAVSKLTSINHALATTNFDIIFLQETWFLPTTDSSLLVANSVFDVYRSDRKDFVRQKEKGGGVATLFRRVLDLKPIKLPKTSVEIQAMSLGNYVFVNCYLPNYGTAHTLTRIDDISVCLKYIRQVFDDDLIGGLRAELSEANQCERKFAEEIASMGFVQSNHIPNNNTVFLDLIFSNDFPSSQVDVVPSEDAIDPPTRHHLPLSMKISTCLSDSDFPIEKADCKPENENG